MLATDPTKLRAHYDVLIIGSGYGGAITAARLGIANHRAGKKLKIAVLERGVEHPTGSFPATALEFARLLLTSGNPLGMFEFNASSDFFTVQGSGLGGTSLVNGNVCLIPQTEVFENWPRAIREERPSPLEPYYQRALAMLGAVPYADHVALPKARAFELVAQANGAKLHACPLAVTLEPRTTRYGIPRQPCVNCNSCISGCNYEAKNTLDKNYLPMAKHYGVELYTRMEVRQLQALPSGGYQISVTHRRGEKGTDTRDLNLSATRVVLAAGCLGTNGILLRSQSRGNRLVFSRQLGQHFSGNGDYFALAYNTDQKMNFDGWTAGVDPEFHVKGGPTITTFFRANNDKPLRQRATFEEASMPAPFVDTMRNGGFLAAAGQPWKFLNSTERFQRWLADRYRNNEGAINGSILYLGMGFDGADGTIVLDGGKPKIVWPNAAQDPVFDVLRPIAERGTVALGGEELPNPLLAFNVPAHPIPITGHPIGGCATADDPDQGVVDDLGRVYRRDGGVYEGLHVVDGSIFPGSIGVNVLLTISAFAERAVETMRRELGLAPFDRAHEWDDAA